MCFSTRENYSNLVLLWDGYRIGLANAKEDSGFTDINSSRRTTSRGRGIFRLGSRRPVQKIQLNKSVLKFGSKHDKTRKIRGVS